MMLHEERIETLEQAVRLLQQEQVQQRKDILATIGTTIVALQAIIVQLPLFGSRSIRAELEQVTNQLRQLRDLRGQGRL